MEGKLTLPGKNTTAIHYSMISPENIHKTSTIIETELFLNAFEGCDYATQAS